MDNTAVDNPLANAPIKSVGEDAWAYVREHWWIPAVTGVVVVLGLVFGSFLQIPQFFFIAIAVAFAMGAYAYTQARARFMHQIADALGFTYEATGSMDAVAGDLFGFGHGQAITNVLSGVHGDLPLRIYNYQTTVGSGKNSHTYPYTVFEVTYTYDLPHLLMLVKENFFSLNAQGYISFSDGAELKLEGDFGKSFTVYAQTHLELEALEVFTPDVMLQLAERAKKTSFESRDHKLYVFEDKTFSTKEDLSAMYDVALLLMSILTPHFRQTSGSTLAMEQQMNKN